MEDVAEFLKEIICRNGPMEQLHSDQGSEFVNTCIDSITTMLGVQLQITSAYHPQTQGQREKDNRTFKDGLSKLVNKNEDDWDTLIPSFLYTHHSSVHASTKVTPFEVWFGRKSGVFNKSVESAEYEEVGADTLAETNFLRGRGLYFRLGHFQSLY